MSEFLYNLMWWVTGFITFIVWVSVFYQICKSSVTGKCNGFIFTFIFAIIFTSARTPFLNWIGGGL